MMMETEFPKTREGRFLIYSHKLGQQKMGSDLGSSGGLLDEMVVLFMSKKALKEVHDS